MTHDDMLTALSQVRGFIECRTKMAMPGEAMVLLGSWQKSLDMAIDALKAQEPRVMTLEEVVARCGEPAYLESRNSRKSTYVLIYDVQEGMGITGVRIGLTQPGHITIWPARDLYGVKWRCWTARPTDEQREATPWQA